MANKPHILVVDDEPHMLNFLRTVMEVESYKVDVATSGLEALERIQQHPSPDLILLDVSMPGLDGLQTLERMKGINQNIKVVMLSCMTEPATVVKAIQLGALDYLPKPFQQADLEAVIRRTTGRSSTGEEAENVESAEEVGDDVYFVAASEPMRRIRSQVGMIAGVDVPVLILGESGTGKEVVAKLIHKLSPRAARTFLKVNCAALPSELLESELFGYEPGAFTGATKSKPGKFEQCDQGTILLDEIGEMSTGLQAKLLHVLQDGEFSRLGSRSQVRVNVRILAATNVDIKQAIAAKKLREDLYYRLNAFTITVPPLRARREGIPLLLRHFMSRFASRYMRDPLPLTPALVSAAQNYSWPGNLRELENFVKRYLILGDAEQVIQELVVNADVGMSSSSTSASSAAENPEGLKSLIRGLKDEAEIKAISEALQHTNWNRKAAARLLKISYKALLYKIREYGLDDNTRAKTATPGA